MNYSMELIESKHSFVIISHQHEEFSHAEKTPSLCMLRFRQMKRQAEFVPGQGADETGLSLIEEREDRIVLEAAMKVLSQEELSIIVLHSVSGMKHREISEAMQIPISTVLSRYQRGLRKLRKRLEEMNR